MCSGVFLLGFILHGTLCASWTWLTISFSTLGKFSTIISSKFFWYPFLLFFWDPYNSNVGAFDIVPEVSETIISSFHSFLFYSALQKLFPLLCLPAHCFVLLLQIFCYWFLPDSSVSKQSACNAGDPGSIPGSGRFPGEGNGNPLQYSCLENPMDKGAWWATCSSWGRKCQTQLSD